ncbi:MAG: hypothetical protein J6V44_17390 [Methanobrevibacter sp.]|nr:hypothetical protein [Methanobrevibacter sp.]
MNTLEFNKIYLGDAYKLIKELPDGCIDLIVTDPPYDIQGIHGSGIMKTRKAGTFMSEIAEGELNVGIDFSILDDFCRVLKKINCYIWCNRAMILPLLKYFVDGKKCNYEIIIKAKENPIPFCGTHYLCDKEYCLYFWEQGVDIDIPFERGKTVYLTKNNVADKNDYGHPTIKELYIIENLIANSCKGGVVFDPFVGSGTTCLGAKHLGLQWLGFEINEKYYKIACDRLQGINQKGQLNLFDIDN